MVGRYLQYIALKKQLGHLSKDELLVASHNFSQMESFTTCSSKFNGTSTTFSHLQRDQIGGLLILNMYLYVIE